MPSNVSNCMMEGEFDCNSKSDGTLCTQERWENRTWMRGVDYPLRNANCALVSEKEMNVICKRLLLVTTCRDVDTVTKRTCSNVPYKRNNGVVFRWVTNPPV